VGGEGYRQLGEAGWRWVLDQVRWDDGPWIPETPDEVEASGRRDGMHSGIGGLPPALAELRLARDLTAEEERLADGIATRIASVVAHTTDPSYFMGLTSHAGALGLLGEPDGVGAALARLRELATPEGWPQTLIGRPMLLAGAPIHDVVLGTAGVVLGSIWAGGPLGEEVAGLAAGVLLERAEQTPTGLNWTMVAAADRLADRPQLPNFSHGLSGIATALALAGDRLGRAELVDAARLGAEHLVTLGRVEDGGFVVPHYVPHGDSDADEVTYTWCHGPTGTSLLFLALDRAGVAEVAGEPPLVWHARCLEAVRTSGIPERRWPGFWDNDGRCCGTAGVGDLFLDSYQRTGEPADLAFAVAMGDALVERAFRGDGRAWWRFVEHRAQEPLLPPGVGWMQGVAGIAAYLLRLGRVLDTGAEAAAVSRMDNWWALPRDA